jgi:hypothetical protein
MSEMVNDIEQFWFRDPGAAAAKYNGKRIRYLSPFGTWRIGTLEIRDRRDHDDKISATIRESFLTSRYSGQVFTWRLSEDLYKKIVRVDRPGADFELPVS